MENGMVKIIYVDGTNRDGTDHISKKIGKLIKETKSFIQLESMNQTIHIPIARIIRMESFETDESL